MEKPLWERVILCMMLLGLAGTLASITPVGESSRIGQLASVWKYGGFLACGLLLLSHPVDALKTAGSESTPFLLAALAIISGAWSWLPEVTLKKGLGLLALTVAGLSFGRRYSIREQFVLVAWALGIGGIASLIVGKWMPSIGTMAGVPDAPNEQLSLWRGAYIHKNILGQRMEMASLLFGLFIMNRIGNPVVNLAMIALACALMVLSGSWSALAFVFIIGAYAVCFAMIRRHRSLGIAILASMTATGLAGAAVMSVLIQRQAEQMMITAGSGTTTGQEVGGKDLSMSGRVPLWIASVQMGLKRPWLGHGFSAFWKNDELSSEPSPEARVVHVAINWAAPHAHNGFVDVFLELGVAGLALLFLLLWKTSVRAWKVLGAKAGRYFQFENVWPAVFMIFCLLNNLTETFFVKVGNVNWFLFISVTYALCVRSNITDRKET